MEILENVNIMTAEEIYQELLEFIVEKGFVHENNWEHFEATCTFTNDDSEESLKGRTTEFETYIGNPFDTHLKQKFGKTSKVGGGLYAFYNDNSLIYLGKATSLRGRILIHFKELYNIGGDEKYRNYFKKYRNIKLKVKYLKIPHEDKKTLQAAIIVLERLLLLRDNPEFEILYPSYK
jgi:hypothetical protein